MEFCAAAMVQAAHGAVVEKNYGGKCSVDPSAIVSLVLPLQNRIREAVQQALFTMPVSDIDWDVQVLAPLIANFHSLVSLGITSEDVEYIILVATVVTLAYEILLVPEMQQNKFTYAFISKIFADYLCEPEIHHRITERLQLEQRRLENIGATPAIQDAVRNLRLMLPDIWTSIIAWQRSLAEPHASKSGDTSEDNDDNARPFPRDLHIAVSLKSGQSLPFEFVESIDASGDIAVVTTHFGLRMDVQPGFHVADVSDMFDAVTLSARDDQTTGCAATIIVPPGYAYRVTNVESVFEVEARPPRTVIETSKASFEVSRGDYLVKRRNCHNSVLIESTEC